MTNITIDEISELNSISGNGYFDRFMHSTNEHLKLQYDKHRIKSSEYATVYLGAMQSALTEAVKFAIGKQLASAQADLAIANTSKVQFDKDLIAAEIRYKDAVKDNTVTENGLIVEKIHNLEKDTLIKIQEEQLKAKDVLLTQARIDKTLKEVDKVIADIAKTNQDTANALTTNAMIVKETALVAKNIEKADKIIEQLTQEILKTAEEVNLIIAKTGNTDASTAHINKTIEQLTQNILKTIEETSLTTARTSNVLCETNKCGSETNLIKARVNTEKANTDASVIGSNSLLDKKLDLISEQVKTEQANTDSSVVGEDSIIDKKLKGIDLANQNIKYKFDPTDIVIEGSQADCEAKLACAKFEVERAQYTPVGNNPGEVHPDSILGAKTDLLRFQAQSEKANVDGSDINDTGYLHHKIVKMEADAKRALSEYDPLSAGVVAGSKLDCEAKLTCARVDTEKANFTPIGTGVDDIHPSSLLGAKAHLYLAQAETEEAQLDPINVKPNSMYEAKIAKMAADANVALARYNPTQAGVQDNSLVDCEAKLKCAQAKSEEANFTSVGNNVGDISPTSYLGARTKLQIAQADTERANVESGVAATGSYVKAKIDYLDAQRDHMDAQSLESAKKALLLVEEAGLTKAKYNSGASSGSLIACQAKLYCAQADEHKAQYNPNIAITGSIIAHKADQESYRTKALKAETVTTATGLKGVETTLMTSKAFLLASQKATEQARKNLLDSQKLTEDGKPNLQTAQESLYNAQATHYAADTKTKKAKLYVDMYSVSATQVDDISGVGTITSAQAKTVVDTIS